MLPVPELRPTNVGLLIKGSPPLPDNVRRMSRGFLAAPERSDWVMGLLVAKYSMDEFRVSSSPTRLLPVLPDDWARVS